MRSLGKIEIFMPMLQEEEISPNEYYKMVQSAKKKPRKRASRSNNNNNEQEDSEWVDVAQVRMFGKTVGAVS